MSVSDLERAATFVRGVAFGDPDLVTKFVDPDRYVEHNPLVGNGVVGPRDHVVFLPKDGSELQIVRTLQDGEFIVLQADADVLGRRVLFDVFRFDEGLIVEHWLFSAEAAPPNKSGHTQADGPTQPTHLAESEANKRAVRDYYETVHLGARHDRAREWFLGDLMIRHEPGVADGGSEFLRDLEVLSRDRTFHEIKILVGQGDLVFIVARGTHRREPCAYVDLYRVQDGRIVEHWGFSEPIPGERMNSSGMF